MVQCEMCGTETTGPRTAKIEGAELQVCDACVEFGTEISDSEPSSTSTKYSTAGSGTGESNQSRQTGSSGQTTASTRQRSSPDLFDDLGTLATDYPERIRNARESRGLSQEDLAKQLNEKASLIHKLERGEMQPSDDVQAKLERQLSISLDASNDEDDTEWKSDVSPGTTTLGDVVRRRD